MQPTPYESPGNLALLEKEVSSGGWHFTAGATFPEPVGDLAGGTGTRHKRCQGMTRTTEMNVDVWNPV